MKNVRASPINAIRQMLFAVVCLYGVSSQASVSCDPAFTFIGQSVDGEKAYWERRTAGDCDETRELWEYEFGHHRIHKIRAVNLTEGESAEPYLQVKEQIADMSVKPRSFYWTNEGGQSQNADFSDYPQVRMEHLCRLEAPDLELTEEGQYGVVGITSAHYNQRYKAWVVITDHHYSANSCDGREPGQCPTNQALRVYDLGQSKDLSCVK